MNTVHPIFAEALAPFSPQIQLLPKMKLDSDLMQTIRDAHALLKKRRESGQCDDTTGSAELILHNAIVKYGGGR